jgi:hypothetical protein
VIDWDPENVVWAHFHRQPEKYWNAFGVDDPSQRKTIVNSVQINPSRQAHLSTGGAFISDEASDTVFIAHSGRIGGESVGQGDRFLTYFDRYFDIVDVHTRRGIKRYILVAEIWDRNLNGLIADFVRACAAFKTAGRTYRGTAIRKARELASDEYAGTIIYTRKGAVKTIRRHGVIFKALKQQLEKNGIRNLKRDMRRDLYLSQGGRNVLFEIKTDVNYSLYTAVGQLMIHGKGMSKSARCFLVSPDIPSGYAGRLRSLGIGLVTFTEKGRSISFQGLKAACRACGH